MFIALFVFMTLCQCTGTNMPTIILETLLQYFSEFLATTVVFNWKFYKETNTSH